MTNPNLKSKIENISGAPESKKTIDPKELLKKLVYKPATLVWKNFSVEQPQADRWFLMWCNLGKIAPNLYVSYRDAQGNYELPHPTKQYPAQAWAYIDNPEIDQAELDKIQDQLKKEAEKNTASDPVK